MTEDKKNIHQCDVVVVGAGIAGLWIANRLKRLGYHVVVVDKCAAGAGQTLASQGMIHGGQKYLVTGIATDAARAIAAMPARWQDCFDGHGDVDLTTVAATSETQVMWPAGGVVAGAAVLAAAKLVNAATRKMKKDELPEVLSGLSGLAGAVYELPEKVLDVRSLMAALMAPLKGRVLRGEMTEILPDGQIAISGRVIQAQLVVVTAGTGNEEVFRHLKITRAMTQRRPLRQIMVRWMDDPLYGHGITASPKPRVTVTAHRAGSSGGYVWYLGGDLAERAASMDNRDALRFARDEMAAMFPAIDWSGREWASWLGDRAEPFAENGHLPPGPVLQQRGRILVCWPVKLTFAPLLADRVIDWLRGKDVTPAVKDSVPDLPHLDIGAYPWDTAVWTRLGDSGAAGAAHDD